MKVEFDKKENDIKYIPECDWDVFQLGRFIEHLGWGGFTFVNKKLDCVVFNAVNLIINICSKPYMWLKNSRKQRNFMWGSASSSKSHTIAQFLCFGLFPLANVGILVVRKTRPAVEASCWPLVRGYLDKAEIVCRPNLSKLTLTGSNGSFMMFDGLDNIAKKKSIEGINFIWVEELAGLSKDTEITQREFDLLDTICRAPANPKRPNQVFASFNPCDQLRNQWIEDITKRGDTDEVGLYHINYEDNPFLPEREKRKIERIAETDYQYKKVYMLGQWAVLKGQIYDNWDIVTSMPDEYERRIWGLDFGYVNPAALIECRIIGRESWEKEHIYQTGLTNPQLAAKVKAITGEHEKIIADSAEPKSIQELVNAGLNVFPASKGPDSVSYGINSVRQFKTHLLESSVNLRKEKAGYKWQTDKDDKIKQPPKPVDFENHLMDAERYALDSLVRKVKAGLLMTDTEDEYDPDEAMWTKQE
jgi:phage terminase large subunit